MPVGAFPSFKVAKEDPVELVKVNLSNQEPFHWEAFARVPHSYQRAKVSAEGRRSSYHFSASGEAIKKGAAWVGPS